jgi:selenocysteine lyase/cysteine desulfurase
LSGNFDVHAFRSHFRSLPSLVYLNSGSYGLLSNAVAGAFEQYLQTRIAVGADWGGWVGLLEKTRTLMASLLQVDSDEVAITGSASAGLNAIASAFNFSGSRNKLIVSNFDFPTSAQIWHAQEPFGATVVHVPESEDGIIPLEHFERVIDESTALVVLSQVCYRHGGRIPDDDIRAIARMAHDKGALVLLDSYQIIGSEPIHPRTLDVDICAGGMLKYLLGTAGIGFLYVRGSLIQQLSPRASGWFAQADIHAMNIFANDPSLTARRFEAGTPSVASCGAAAAGLQFLLDTGLDAIGKQVHSVTRYALDRLADAGIKTGNPVGDDRRGPLISIPSRDQNALVASLAEQNIITSCRDGRLRAGFHAYNHEADVDVFLTALIDRRALLVA